MFNFMRLPPLRRLMLMKAITGGGSWSTISGNPVSFTAKAAPLRQLSVAFSPVQSLNGYDAPWPAGGGKNLADYTNIDWGTVSDGWITFNDGVTSGTDTSVQTKIVAGTDYTLTIEKTTACASYVSRIQIYDSENNKLYDSSSWHSANPMTYKFNLSADGVRVNLTTKAESSSVAKTGTFRVQIEKGSSSTAWTPYSNICPISGWDGVEIYDDPLYAGVIEWNQLFNYVGVSPSQAQGVTCINNNDGTFTCDGVATSRAYKLLATVATIAGHKYYIGGCPSGGDTTRYLMNIDAETGSVDTGSGAIFTSTRASSQLYIAIGKDYTVSNLVFTPQFCDLTLMFGAGNEPATVDAFKALFPHDYYAYNAGTETTVGAVNGMDTRSISISLGQTVYSGYVDVISGVGEITGVCKTYDGSEDEGWAKYETGSASAFAMSFYNSDLSNDWTFLKSSYLKPISTTVAWGAFDNWISTVAGTRIVTGIKSITTIEAWVAYLAENPIQIYAKLNTPIPIQLTPQEVKSLAGDNTMWSTANGDLTVEYRSN